MEQVCTTFPLNHSKSVMVRAASVDVANECAEAAPFRWQIRCTKFQPALFDRGLLGFANFELPGGLVLADGRIYRAPHGGLCVKFRELGILSANEPARRENGTLKTLRPISFSHHLDWLAFSNAAVAAVRVAYPGQLPGEAQA